MVVEVGETGGNPLQAPVIPSLRNELLSKSGHEYLQAHESWGLGWYVIDVAWSPCFIVEVG